MSYEMRKLMLLLLIVCRTFSESKATPAIKPQSQRGIIFPAIEQYEECFVDEQHVVKGICKPLSECASAVSRWEQQNIRPQTCYFNKFDHIVCCEQNTTIIVNDEFTLYTPRPDVKRRSETECELYYGPKISVVHGEPTKPKEFPYMAALGWLSFFDNSLYYRCGGVLVSKKFVLTAAHCAALGGSPPAAVRLGGVNLTDSKVQDIKVRDVYVHPGYNVTSSYNDIALVELEEDVSDMPACIWSETEVPHNNVTAIGYGHTRFAGSGSDQLLKVELAIVPNVVCQRYYKPDMDTLTSGVASTHICAGDPEHLRDTCQGDSGGPIIMRVQRDSLQTYVVGITSFGQDCANEPPSIYTRTSSYVDWIEDIVWPSKGANANTK